MAFFRLYSGDDGESHMDEVILENAPDLTNLHDAKHVVFRSAPIGRVSDWHNAPRRQYIITLSGEAEIELGDGKIIHLGAGDVNIAEDMTGHGHITRVVGNAPRVTATVHLED